MTAPMDIRAARATIDSVITHITAARRALGEGHAVSLAPLQEITRQACRDVAALPAEDRRGLRSLLEAVLYDLDTLAADLTARYGTLVRRADHGGHRPPTVGDAYRRSDLLAAGRRQSAAAGEEEAPPLGSGPSGEAS